MRRHATLDGRVFRVASTACNGVIGAGTRLELIQRGDRILGKYRGGSIRRGVLVGTLARDRLRFRYLQCESSGELQGGESTCDVEAPKGGRVRIVEHFTWRTRDGSGTNVFEEIENE